MKKSYVKSLSFIIVTSALVFAGFVVSQTGGFSAGMGVPHDVAQQLDGLSLDDWGPILEQNWDRLDEGDSSYTAPTTPVPSTPQPAQGNGAGAAGVTANQGSAAAPQPKAKIYTHDYDAITDEAKEAFIHFTKDGEPDSCYLNINNASTDNKITGKELNATKKNKETGKISFMSGESVAWEFIFEDWESEDDYELDLTTHYSKLTTSEYEDTYTLNFTDGKKISDTGNKVRFRLDTGMKDSEIHIYEGSDSDDFLDAITLTTDEDGFVEFELDGMTDYTISKTDILAAKAEREEIVETEEATEETAEAVEAEPTEEAAPSEEAPTEAVEASEAPAEAAPAQNSTFPVIPVAAGVGVVVLLIAVIAIVKKVRK